MVIVSKHDRYFLRKTHTGMKLLQNFPRRFRFKLILTISRIIIIISMRSSILILSSAPNQTGRPWRHSSDVLTSFYFSNFYAVNALSAAEHMMTVFVNYMTSSLTFKINPNSFNFTFFLSTQTYFKMCSVVLIRKFEISFVRYKLRPNPNG